MKNADHDDLVLLHGFMKAYIREYLPGRAENQPVCISLANLIETYLSRIIHYPLLGAGYRHRLDRMWEDVNRSLQHPWNLKELAQQSGLSERQLVRNNTACYKLPPAAMLSRLRINRAREYLRSSDFTLETIAELVGFSSPYALSNAYKRISGRRPRDDRNGNGNLAADQY